MLTTRCVAGLAQLGAVIALAAACSMRPDFVTLPPLDAATPDRGSGKIEMHLTLAGSALLPNGATIATVNYAIAGPTSASGSVDVSASQSIEFVVGNLVAGTGYTIQLSAVDSAGDSCTSPSAPFAVNVGETTQVAINLVCFVSGDASTSVDGNEAGCSRACGATDASSADRITVDADATADSTARDGMGCVDETNCDAFVTANNSTFLLTDNGVCTATELTLYVKAVSGQAAGACLACAAMGSCLDDSFDASDVLRECEDAPATTEAGASGMSECLAALSCGLGVSGSCGAFASSAAPAQSSVIDGYCGTGVSTANCTATSRATDAGTGPQGVCVAPETAGFPSGFTPAQIVGAFEAPSQPAGLANQLLACLNLKCTTQCFP